MQSQQTQLPLIDPTPQIQWLSSDCALHRDGDLVAVFIGGSPLFRFDAGSRLDARLAAAVLANAKAAPIQSILAVFQVDDATLWRVRRRLEKEGVAGLLKGKPGPKRPVKLIGPVVRRIAALRREKGLSSREIAVRLRLSHTAVLAALHAAGEAPVEKETGQSAPLPFGTDPLPTEAASEAPVEAASVAPAEAVSVVPAELPAEAVSVVPAELPAEAVSVVSAELPAEAASVAPAELPAEAASVAPADGSPLVPAAPVVEPVPTASAATRVLQLQVSARCSSPELAVFYAKLGLTIDGEAEVVLESQDNLPNAGFFLAVPALAATGLLDAARQVYGGLRRGVYGLRATILVLALLALLRRPRPEHLTGADPSSLGDVLGLLRAPEVKTVRRKLAEVARVKKAHLLMEAVARRWLAEKRDGDELGTLYIDGHVRDYHGKHTLPKTHISQRNLCAPATTDYWVNGVDGDPVFVVTAKANAAMTQMLPVVISKAEELSGGLKGTIVFDRGGWSPKLFKKIILEMKWHILTYRKGTIRKHPSSGFKEQSLVIDGKERRYTLSERNVLLKNGLKLREIAELRDDGGQTIILTSHFDKNIVLLAYRMFERWRQENFFRYMKENFALDALVDYTVEPDDAQREVPNPARKALEKKLKVARTELAKREREYGAAAAANPESKRPTVRGFKIANGDIGQAIREAKETVQKLESQRRQLPKRVAVAEAIGTTEVVKLSTERKLFTDVIKAASYRAETTLLRLLAPHFPRAEDEGRAFLKAAMKQRGDLIVDGDDVTIRLAPMSAPRFTAALTALCDGLNALNPTFPETTYRLNYEVAGVAK